MPALASCTNVPKAPATLLINQGWPSADKESYDPVLASIFTYLSDVKSTIRLSHVKATTGRKKVSKASKEEEKATLENVVLFVGHEFPEYQRKVIEILGTFEFNDGKIQGDYISKIRTEIKGKEGGLALKFAAHIAGEAEVHGKDKAFSLKVPFDEVAVIQDNFDFLYENMPTIKHTTAMMNNSEGVAAIPNGAAIAANAVPGKPTAHFY